MQQTFPGQQRPAAPLFPRVSPHLSSTWVFSRHDAVRITAGIVCIKDKLAGKGLSHQEDDLEDPAKIRPASFFLYSSTLAASPLGLSALASGAATSGSAGLVSAGLVCSAGVASALSAAGFSGVDAGTASGDVCWT